MPMMNETEESNLTHTMEKDSLLEDNDYYQINKLYDECLDYLKNIKLFNSKNILVKEEDRLEYEDTNSGYESIEQINDIHNSEDKTSPDSEMRPQRTNNGYSNIELKEISKSTINFAEKQRNPITKLTTNYAKSVDQIDKLNKSAYKVENEIVKDIKSEVKSERLRRLSQQLPKIIITQSNTSLQYNEEKVLFKDNNLSKSDSNITRKAKRDPFGANTRMKKPKSMNGLSGFSARRLGYGDFPRRLVSKGGMENVALISNVPFEKIRLLNDTFHTLINLRWRWIVMGTVVVHFLIWLVFAVFWYITALAHYDFSPNPPARTCVTGGKDFLTIFLASVEAQTTIGFGDRAIDEECPESIFLFIMQLILGTGLSGVLTCVVYAKLTRPEKLSRDGVGFSKKAVISIRDGRLCLMLRAWDLNYDHIIGSEFSAHFVYTHRTKEGEVIRYYAHSLTLQQRQFLLWPVTLVHVIDEASPLWKYTPESIASQQYEITVSLKGASASMGTFTQSQTSYTPKEILWGHRFPPVVKYDRHKQKYVIEHKKLDATEPVPTPRCSASELHSISKENPTAPTRPETPSSFSEKISAFVLERTSSFRNIKSSPKQPSTPRATTPSDFTDNMAGLVLQRASSFRST